MLNYEHDKTHLSKYRWGMLLLLWLLYVSFGIVSRAIFPLVTPILNDLSLIYSQMGLILGSWQLTYIIMALGAGSILDRWGVRKSLFAGAIIIGLSSSLRYFANDFTTLLTAVALFGVGGPMISIGGPKTISSWFSGPSRGTAIGLYTSGNWIGGLLALALTNSLVMPLVGNDWKQAFVVYGMITFGVGLLWILCARETEGGETPQRMAIIDVFRNLAKLHNVRIVLTMGLLAFAISHGFSSWLPKILEINGMSGPQAGFAASITIAAGIPSILILPSVVPPRYRGRTMAMLSILTAVNIVLVMKISGMALYTGLAVLGFISAPLLALLLLILMDSPGVETRYMGSAGGMFYCVAEIGGFAGPFFMGVLVDLTGTFMAGALFLASLCFAIAALTFFLKHHQEAF
ncbi:CynX/NimT family MFS transporter [Thermodesulfobacteriota bacterium]